MKRVLVGFFLGLCALSAPMRASAENQHNSTVIEMNIDEAQELLKFAYYEEPKPTQEVTREFVWDNFDVNWVIEEPNGGFIRIEQKTDINLDNVLVSAGTNIDVLMDYFKHHTSEVIQRVVEKEFPNAIPTDDT